MTNMTKHVFSYDADKATTILNKLANIMVEKKIRSLNQVNRYKKPGKELTDVEIYKKAVGHINKIIQQAA